MQFTKNSMENVQKLLNLPLISKLTKTNYCIYIFGGALTDALLLRKTPVIKIFSFDDFDIFSNLNIKWEEIKQKSLFGEQEYPICWKTTIGDITYLLYTKQSIHKTLHKEIINPDEILSLCNFNYEMIYIPTSTKELHGTNDFMTFFERKLISLLPNKKMESNLVNVAIKASKRYKYPFDNKLAREISQFLKSVKSTK